MSKLVRKASAHAGKISQLDLKVVEVFGYGPMGAAITAVRNGDGHLQLIKWQVAADGAPITRVGDAHAGAISEVAMTVVHNHVLTAVRNGAGKLEVISWTQDLAREGSGTSGPASELSICGFLYENDPDFFATACRDDKGNLRVEVWSLSSNGTPTLRGAASAGALSEVTLAFVGKTASGYRFISAVRNGSGDLELIQWSASADGTTVQRVGSSTAGAASEISSQTNGVFVVTSFRNGAGDLELISWLPQSDGSITRVKTAWAGSVGAVSSGVSFELSGKELVTTAVCNGAGDLELIDWQLSSTGELERKASATAGTVSSVRVDSAWDSKNPSGKNPSPNTILISAMRNGSADLELISWARE